MRLVSARSLAGVTSLWVAVTSSDAGAQSYREQLLVSDLSAYATIGLSSYWLGSDNPVAYLGALGYFVGPVIVHGRHDHWDRAAESFGLRAGLPLGGALLGCAVGSVADTSAPAPSEGLDLGAHAWCIVGGLIGGAAGLVTALAVDYTTLSREPSGGAQLAAPLTMSFSGVF